jgi:hypothetical protein
MKSAFLFLIVLISIVLTISTSYAQQQPAATNDSDSTIVPPTQKELAEKKLANKGPNKAALLSAILPGAGQFYNHKYWKPPILYVGFGICTYLFITTNQEFQQYKSAYTNLNNLQTSTGNTSLTYNGYNLTQVGIIRDQDRLYSQTNLIIIGGLYLLNVIDAYVDAHLMEFNMSDNLSMKVSPLLYTANYSHLATGLSLSLRFK